MRVFSGLLKKNARAENDQCSDRYRWDRKQGSSRQLQGVAVTPANASSLEPLDDYHSRFQGAT